MFDVCFCRLLECKWLLALHLLHHYFVVLSQYVSLDAKAAELVELLVNACTCIGSFLLVSP